MANDVNAVIEQLRELDLSTYPTDKINGLFKAFGRVGTIDYRLHPGKVILRARPEDNQWPYLTRSAHNFKPQDFNKTYQRASTPDRTMFYGSIIPEEFDKGDLDNERVVVTTEASPWIRAKNSCGVRRIAYSKWEVVEDVRMIAVLQHKGFYNASSHTRKVIDDFMKSLAQYPETMEASLLVSEYIAGEFGKEQTSHDYDYIISALYTEMITRHGFDGILYPSVRMGGQGFNIALTPDAANGKLKLIAAGECTIYKRFYGNSVVDNNTIAVIDDEKMPFEYHPVDAPYNAGKKACLAELGVNTVEELCTKRGHL